MTDQSAGRSAEESAGQSARQSARQSAGEDGARPVLRVVRGDPTDEELAALVAVVAALTAPAGHAAPRPRSEWAAPRRSHRRPLTVDPAGWRSSSLPS